MDKFLMQINIIIGLNEHINFRRTSTKSRFGSMVRTVQKNSEGDLQNHDLITVNDNEDDYMVK